MGNTKKNISDPQNSAKTAKIRKKRHIIAQNDTFHLIHLFATFAMNSRMYWLKPLIQAHANTHFIQYSKHQNIIQKKTYHTPKTAQKQPKSGKKTTYHTQNSAKTAKTRPKNYIAYVKHTLSQYGIMPPQPIITP